MSNVASKTSGQLHEAIIDSMDVLGITPRELAAQVGVSYESIRRIRNGFPPSRPLLKEICNVLQLDFPSMEKLLVATQITHKYGDIPYEISGKDMTLLPVEKMWPLLTEEQRQGVISMVNGWVQRNKASS